MQHSEEYGRSVKSYVAHLTALCCWVKAPDDKELYWKILRWLDGPIDLARPRDLSCRGSVTIADVRNPAREEEYPDLVRRWANDVWLLDKRLDGIVLADVSGGLQLGPVDFIISCAAQRALQ